MTLSEKQLNVWLAPRLLPWQAKVVSLVERRIADARSHAEGAVTQTILDAPDGRATWQIASRSRFVAAAESRLREMLDQLVGPTTRSLDGLLRRANAAFYRQAILEIDWGVPEAIRAKTYGQVSKRRLRDARGLVLFSKDLRSEVSPPVEEAIRNLKAAVIQACQLGSTKGGRKHIFDLWEAWAKGSLSTIVRNALGNAQFALLQLAGRDQVEASFHAKPLALGTP